MVKSFVGGKRVNYYELFQIRENASSEVIKMAYKALVKKYHPDTFKGDKSFAEEMTKKINEAYDVLSDPIKKDQYDSMLKNQHSGCQENTAESSTVIRTTTHKKKFKKKPIIIGVVCTVATVLIVILVMLLFGNNGNKEIENVSLRTITFADENTAEYVYSAWKNGGASERYLAELMNQYGAKQGDQGAGRVYFVEPGEYVKEIDEWCFSPKRKIGDCAIIKNTDGYSICYISDMNTESDYYIDLSVTDDVETTDNVTVTWLSEYRFLYYEDFSKFVLLFELSNESETAVAAHGTVKIRIVNDDNITVYDKTRSFTELNFENWTYGDTEDLYLAAIYIELDEIISGSTELGTVYFTVYGDDYSFEECSTAAFDLPTKSASSNISSSAEASPQTTNPQTEITSSTNNKNDAESNPQSTPETTIPYAQTEPETTKPQQSTIITCLDYSCKNTVSKSGEYCSEHRCSNGSCTFKKDYNSQYCTICQCINVGCKNLKIPSGYHCAEHTCKAFGCTSEKQYSSDYCITHKCFSCDSIKIDNGSYCVDHTCSKSGCTSDKQYGSEYCMSHTCLAGLCKDLRVDGGQYCEEHTCVVPGCKNQKFIDDYCYFHIP